MQQQLCTIEYQNWLQWCNSIQLFHFSFLRRNPIFLITKTKYIWVYDYSFCYLFILKRVVRVFILSYLLGGSHFLLSLQPTTTGVILSLYFIVNVRREVRKVNGLINWWSNMSWVGDWVWATSNITPQWWQKSCSKLSLSNCKTLVIKPIIMPPTLLVICKAMDNVVQSCHIDGRYILTPKSWWGNI